MDYESGFYAMFMPLEDKPFYFQEIYELTLNFIVTMV